MNIVLCKIMSLLWDNDVSEQDFCNAIGINKSAVTDWKKGKTQSYRKHVKAISEYFNVAESYFSEKCPLVTEPMGNVISFETAGTPITDEARRIGRAYDNAPNPVKRTVEVALEPYMDAATSDGMSEIASEFAPDIEAPVTTLRLFTQSSAAGLGNYLDDEHFEMEDFRGVPRRADIAVRVSGDSMEPKYQDGDIVFVETDSVLEEGEVGIFCCNGDGYIKVLRKNPLRLESLNDKYEDIVIQEGMAISALGRVVGKA